MNNNVSTFTYHKFDLLKQNRYKIKAYFVVPKKSNMAPGTERVRGAYRVVKTLYNTRQLDIYQTCLTQIIVFACNLQNEEYNGEGGKTLKKLHALDMLTQRSHQIMAKGSCVCASMARTGNEKHI